MRQDFLLPEKRLTFETVNKVLKSKTPKPDGVKESTQGAGKEKEDLKKVLGI